MKNLNKGEQIASVLRGGEASKEVLAKAPIKEAIKPAIREWTEERLGTFKQLKSLCFNPKNLSKMKLLVLLE